MNKKKGQIWVETVIYMLVAFAMIALVLAFIRPKIEELRDKAVIDQSIEILNGIDSTFSEILIPGNKRIVEVGIKRGDMIITPDEDKLIIQIESSYVYSEPDVEVYVGDLIIITQEKGKYNLVTITRDYSEEYNITYQNQEITKSLTKSSVPYKLLITNEGKTDGKTQININLI
jgi:hypothetical protein